MRRIRIRIDDLSEVQKSTEKVQSPVHSCRGLGLKRSKKRAAAMLAGSTLCAVFAGLLLAEYRKQ
jgi:hypothetical protein